MKMKDKTKCFRCSGKGFVNTPRAHLNVPGLCFNCDGDGNRETELKNKKARAAFKKAQQEEMKKTSVIFAKIQETRTKNHVRLSLKNERWPFICKLVGIERDQSFTTQQYALEVGIDLKQAWIELCSMNETKVYVKFDTEYNPIGWEISH